jgi:hypothetical protein
MCTCLGFNYTTYMIIRWPNSKHDWFQESSFRAVLIWAMPQIPDGDYVAAIIWTHPNVATYPMVGCRTRIHDALRLFRIVEWQVGSCWGSDDRTPKTIQNLDGVFLCWCMSPNHGRISFDVSYFHPWFQSYHGSEPYKFTITVQTYLVYRKYKIFRVCSNYVHLV